MLISYSNYFKITIYTACISTKYNIIIDLSLEHELKLFIQRWIYIPTSTFKKSCLQFNGKIVIFIKKK